MSRAKRILAYAAVVILLLLLAGITFTVGWRPFIGPRSRPLTGRTFERTPERLGHGKYLAKAVTGCIDCHSPHDWTRRDAPVPLGMEGAGAVFPLQGLPGMVVAPNLTPDPETGSGDWSDDALARAIREGIGHDGRALFPLMPYPNFRHMSDEDVASVVVFLRSLPPVRNPLPQTEIMFPVKYLIRNAPQPLARPVASPDLAIPAARGEYLETIAACGECHTPTDRGRPLPNMEMAGGFTFHGPWGTVASANITPDPSGISYYDETLFIQMMRTGYLKARELSPIMPWTSYRGMTDDDLKSVFAYLRTLKPVEHRVDNTEPPMPCKLCRMTHGTGAAN